MLVPFWFHRVWYRRAPRQLDVEPSGREGLSSMDEIILEDDPDDGEVVDCEPAVGISAQESTPTDFGGVEETLPDRPGVGPVVDLDETGRNRLHRVQLSVLGIAAFLMVFYPVFAGVLAQTEGGEAIAEQLMGNPFSAIVGIFGVVAGYAYGNKS